MSSDKVEDNNRDHRSDVNPIVRVAGGPSSAIGESSHLGEAYDIDRRVQRGSDTVSLSSGFDPRSISIQRTSSAPPAPEEQGHHMAGTGFQPVKTTKLNLTPNSQYISQQPVVARSLGADINSSNSIVSESTILGTNIGAPFNASAHGQSRGRGYSGEFQDSSIAAGIGGNIYGSPIIYQQQMNGAMLQHQSAQQMYTIPQGGAMMTNGPRMARGNMPVVVGPAGNHGGPMYQQIPSNIGVHSGMPMPMQGPPRVLQAQPQPGMMSTGPSSIPYGAVPVGPGGMPIQQQQGGVGYNMYIPQQQPLMYPSGQQFAPVGQPFYPRSTAPGVPYDNRYPPQQQMPMNGIPGQGGLVSSLPPNIQQQSALYPSVGAPIFVPKSDMQPYEDSAAPKVAPRQRPVLRDASGKVLDLNELKNTSKPKPPVVAVPVPGSRVELATAAFPGAKTEDSLGSLKVDAAPNDIVAEPSKEPVVSALLDKSEVIPPIHEMDQTKISAPSPEPITKSVVVAQDAAEVVDPPLPGTDDIARSGSITSDDDWENAGAVDVLKLHVAAVNSSPLAPDPMNTAVTTDFIFPSKAGSAVGDADAKRNKKSSKKDRFATADAAAADSGMSGMLDAYTVPLAQPIIDSSATSKQTVNGNTSSVKPSGGSSSAGGSTSSKNAKVPIKNTASKSSSAVPTKSSPTASAPAVHSPTIVPVDAVKSAESDVSATDSDVLVIAPNDSDEWDKVTGTENKPSGLTIPAATTGNSLTVTPPARRSLRPGGGTTQVVLNAGLKSQIDRPRVTYTKKELQSLIPNPMVDRPPVMLCYENIIVTDSSGQGRKIPTAGMLPVSAKKSESSSDQWNRKTIASSAADQRYVADQQALLLAHQQANISQNNTGRGKGKRDKNAGPPPKKIISDPLERYTREVQALLNKISPQNFQKLMVDLMNIPCESSDMLEKLVFLIFEKALQEPTFAKLYADLCTFIEDQSSQLLSSFYYVIYFESALQYRWANHLSMPLVFTGPFVSEAECLIALSGPVLPSLQPVNSGQLVHVSLTLRGETLIQVAKVIDTRDPRCYYGTYIPYNAIDPETLSDKASSSIEGAIKDYAKKNGFRKHLIINCQEEFVDSVRQEAGGRYDNFTQRMKTFSKTKFSTESERLLEVEAIEEMQSKLKRRMLGNIRFIGELFKVKLLKERNICDCLEVLMQKEDGSGWRVMDERSIEILCKLLTTVGADIQSQESLNSFFKRMEDMTVDKILNLEPRLKYALIEVIELRKNDWEGRRVPPSVSDFTFRSGGQTLGISHRYINNLGSRSLPIGNRTRTSSGGAGNPAASIAPSLAPTLGSMPLAPAVSRNTPGPSSPPIGIFKSTNTPNNGYKDGTRGSPSVSSPSMGGDVGSKRTSLGSAGGGSTTSTPVVSRKRSTNISGLIDEYFSIEPNTPDSDLTLEDLRNCVPLELVKCIFQRSLEAKGKSLVDLVRLSEQLASQLGDCTSEIERAISQTEPLQLLVDTVVDYRNAPEQLGSIICALWRGNACSQTSMSKIIRGLLDKCLSDADEVGDPRENVEVVFARLRASAGLP